MLTSNHARSNQKKTEKEREAESHMDSTYGGNSRNRLNPP